ncbi:MAG: protein kinase [Myxococcota bacterium]
MTSGSDSARSLGRYQLLFMLGQGGMGEVHLAKLSGAAGFEKLCIVKTILPQMQADPSFVDRFHHEARVLVHLNHSNIAQVYDMGDVDGTLYMAIEYVPGVDVARVQSRVAHARLMVPLPIALFIGQRIAEALGYAHRKTGPDGASLGIVHRDVSPQNVMVSYEGEVKVIDFGLAKSAVRSKHTLPSTVMGKLGYMSPEQAMAQPVDHRSDIYSAGIVVWELIAGRPLFEGGTMAEMVVKMAQPTIPTLRSVRSEVSVNLDRVVMRALAVDPSARYARADDFARALNELAVREALTIGAEEVGNYVRAMCPEEFAAERALQSKLSVMRKRGQALATPLPAPEIEGTILKPSSPGEPAPELTPAQKALSVSTVPARSQHKAIPRTGSAPLQAPSTAPEDAGSSAPMVVPRSKAPWIIVGVLGVAAAGVLTAAFLKSREPKGPQPVPVADAPVKGSEVAEHASGAEAKPAPSEDDPGEDKPADAELKPLGTVNVTGPIFPVKQSDDSLLVLLKDKKALKKGDQLDLIGDPAGGKTAPLFGEGVVMSVVGGMAEIGVYDEARLPDRVFAMKDLKPAAATAQRTVGKPRKSAVGAAAATSAPEKTQDAKVETKTETKPAGETKVATADPIVPAMEPDNPFDKSKQKVDPAKTEPAKVEPAKVEPIQTAPAASVKQISGTVQLLGPKTGGWARLTNRSAFSLTNCSLRLPGPVVYKFAKEIYAGASADVPLGAFVSTGAHVSDAQFEKGWVPLFCKEATGYLRLIDQRQ